MTDLNTAARRAAIDAAKLRQITDQMEWDSISRARDEATRLLALGAYDDAPDHIFDDFLDALGDTDEAIEAALDPESDLSGGWLTRYREKKKKRKARRAKQRKERKLKRKKKRAKRKNRRDRRKVGVSQSIQAVDTEDAAAATGGTTPEASTDDESADEVPFYKKPIFIAGAGLAGLVTVGLLFMGGKKDKKGKD